MTYVLLGPNGAGKTTTISMVAGLLERDGGEVVVAGEPMTTRAIRAKSAIGLAAERGLRVQVAGTEQGSLGGRIRDARLVPYQAIIGEREAAAGQVALRLRGGRQLPALHPAAAIAGITAQVGAHSTELWDDADATAS